jgi:hypothetical protein
MYQGFEISDKEYAMKALWFRVSTRRILDKDERGWTSVDSRSLSLGRALNWILEALPEENVLTDYDEEGGLLTMMIDWKGLPQTIRRPDIPANRR